MLSYKEALRKIFERADYERGDRPPYAERTWRLARVEEFLAQFGHPQHAFRSVHIAGTKGKGSTTAMIDSILRAAGFFTGMYSSPHLHTFRERIRIGGELIPEEDVSRMMAKMLPVLEERPQVTVFEIITALAMYYYAERKVDFGVFEVGLGGRLDATNVLRPEVAVITSISLDHTKVLGDTLEAIAWEKAGIIKPHTPVIVAPQRPEAMAVIRRVSQERQAPLLAVEEEWDWRLLEQDWRGQRFSLFQKGHREHPEYPQLFLPLLGDFQLENAAAAVAAIEVLRRKGVPIERDAVRRGLAGTHWPGRLEILGREPWVVVDGAHNPYSIERMFQALQKLFTYERLLLVFGASSTHAPQDLLNVLLPYVDRVFLTQADHPKATPIAELEEIAQKAGRQSQGVPGVRQALEKALAMAGGRDLVLVTGSLFVVAEAREAWAALQGWPPLPSDPPGVY
ncbi:MAG: bifunctional folylpolyglutamate synthase/dihydrofolate synthase [Anaerolineae bacterium]|nr:bifunctional folylpolyglutamate synthase/dihydrofolate synthase [Anaerolineae bacterium]